MEPASGFLEVKSDNCCALDHSMPLYRVLLTVLGQMLVCFSPVPMRKYHGPYRDHRRRGNSETVRAGCDHRDSDRCDRASMR